MCLDRDCTKLSYEPFHSTQTVVEDLRVPWYSLLPIVLLRAACLISAAAHCPGWNVGSNSHKTSLLPHPLQPFKFMFSSNNGAPLIYLRSQEQIEQQQLLHGPASPPPHGQKPNFEDPYDIRSTMNAILVLCVAIASLSILARAYAKLLIMRNVAYEDCKWNSDLTGWNDC